MNDMILNQQQQEKSIRFHGYTIFYTNAESLDQTLNEIFIKKSYEFATDKINPFIIDVGSNIGIATLFFKQSYPDAEILCFEPDPIAFNLLQKNIRCNQLHNIQLINAAVASDNGTIDFFGQIYVPNADARGNSIISSWGKQRANNETIKVTAKQLSAYINQDVDFLKMDIEAAEQQVLLELEQANKLSYIKAIFVEIHMTNKIDKINHLDEIVQLFNRNNFVVTTKEQPLENILPKAISAWADTVKPRLISLRAVQK